jgi:hypothetical protein
MIKNKSHSYKYYSPRRGTHNRLGFIFIILQIYIYTSIEQFKRLKK